jgi:hypothetical protein
VILSKLLGVGLWEFCAKNLCIRHVGTHKRSPVFFPLLDTRRCSTCPRTPRTNRAGGRGGHRGGGKCRRRDHGSSHWNGNCPEYEAKRYEGRVKDGGILLSVHSDSSEWTKILLRRVKRVPTQGKSDKPVRREVASAGCKLPDPNFGRRRQLPPAIFFLRGTY